VTQVLLFTCLPSVCGGSDTSAHVAAGAATCADVTDPPRTHWASISKNSTCRHWPVARVERRPLVHVGREVLVPARLLCAALAVRRHVPARGWGCASRRGGGARRA
jgi:hypothetical protein